MHSAMLYGVEDVRLEEVPCPEPGPGEVLVRVAVAPTCGTDLKVWLRGGHARMLVPPTPFGHEFAGEIAALGEGVSGWRSGERVVANNSAPCFDCFYCRRERFSLCENLLFNNGTFAEYLRIPAAIVRHNLLAVPPGLPLELAAMSEPLACVLHGVEEAGVRAGDTVVVMGDGAIGLMLVAVCAVRGAAVILAGGQSARLAVAEQLGAQVTLNYRQAGDPVGRLRALTEGGRGADVVIEATGKPAAWEAAIATARPGATVLLFGGCARGTVVSVDTENLHYNELTLKGVFHNTPRHVREALALIACRRIAFELLVSDSLPLGKLDEALARMRDRTAIKVAMLPGG
ncbi:MAG: zinc-binding dehydrogenase [Aphanocapsa lilacina HA4352-LM1]|jgi:L-iditol 2-dehydrogenase|nr:zinc-binding dehydrogenase [Aphanocapsa lilacina HA4352-LM1]